ncbi:FadR/GntR family transcriptional regulator [Nocardia carnea]|uniref:FadR/GntR family transcriptional regulator n=1 Tax=Nocardia carnea TaxID=37328 RepID=UPI002459077C|nr:FCD domain-containing protein [Nocardia carnea]
MRAPKASERIAERLRGQIVRGEIPAGEMLPPEKRMVVDLGVSRPTLREAFRILESEGLITVLTGARGGPQVRLPDLSVASRHIGLYLQTRGTTLADLLEARAEFGAACVRFLAQRCTEAGLSDMKACILEQRRIWDAGIDTAASFAHWVVLTGEFHNLIAYHCGNTTMETQYKALADVLGASRAVSIRRKGDPGASADTSYIPGNIEDYEELVRLVEARDVAAAEKHWRAHLRRAAEIVYRNRDSDSVISLFD